MNTMRSDYKINSARKYKIRQRNYNKERKSKDTYFVCAKASTIRERNSDQRQTTGSTTDTETKTLQLPRHPVRKFLSLFFFFLSSRCNEGNDFPLHSLPHTRPKKREKRIDEEEEGRRKKNIVVALNHFRSQLQR